ncbi:MAG: FGGY family carbohydrate kinase [Chloroflexi bacterium]|nr:FGGY family carbohydrate kinase [Chloroflexota bacterium]
MNRDSPSNAACEIVLGIDLGTQGLKLVAFDAASAQVLGSVFARVENLTPAPGWLEQEPQQWWTTLCRLTRDLTAAKDIPRQAVVAIGLSGHMHSIVPLRADGSVAHNCIVWADTRSREQARRISVGANSPLWNPSIAPYSLAKILWLRERRPELSDEIAHILWSKDYLRYRLTGNIATEFSDASGTLMWDFAARAWDDALLADFELSPDLLPDARASSEAAGTLSERAAADLGLSVNTVVAYGGGDCACAVVGSGIPDSDTLLINAGTAVQVFEMRAEPRPFDHGDGVRYLFELGVEGRTFAIGALNSAGHSLEWWRRLLNERMTYAQFDALAADESPNPEGPIFLPFLQGTGTPRLLDGSFGSFVQLSATTDQRALARAVMDGVAFGVKHCAEALVKRGDLSAKKILFTGGLPKSPLMRQILANVFDGEVRFRSFSDMSALGAAAHGVVAAGLAPDARAWLAEFDYGEGRAASSPAFRERYTVTYERYKEWAARITSA